MLRILTGTAIRRPVLVIVIWAAVVVAGYGIGVGVFQRLTTDVGQVPGSESQRAGQALLAATADQPSTVTAIVAGRPVDDPTLRSTVDAARTDVRAIPRVVGVGDPVPSADGSALLFQVHITPGKGEHTAALAVAARLRRIPAPHVAVAGGPLTDSEYGDQAQADVQQAELVSTPLVLLLLLLFFGGLLAAGLPLLVASAGVGVTFGVLYLFSLLTDVSVYAIQVTTMLSVGLAVDYALLIVSRFREERRHCDTVGEAVAAAGRTAGRTVWFSGLTVTVALAGLTVFPDPFLRSMGLAGMAVVLVDMLVALTLLPALLTLFGRRIAPARVTTGGGFFAGVARLVQRRAGLTALLATGLMLLLAVPVLQTRLGRSEALALPASTATRQAYDLLVQHYPDQVEPEPVKVVVAVTGATDPAVAALRDRIAALPEVARVTVEPAGAGLAYLRVVPVATPGDAAGARVVAAIRSLSTPVAVSVTGAAAHLVDYEAMLRQRAPWAALVVLAGTLTLLFAFTGSVVLPVKAVLTNLLSIGAALGAAVWVFQSGHLVGWFGADRQDMTDLTVPVLVAAIAFGLSVDYEVFLLSRIRERHLAGADDRSAAAEGMQQTGRIVTSAALLLAVVFAGFLTGGFTPIKAIGLGLALAVLLDATVVRMVLVPATMTVLGRLNWYAPGRFSGFSRVIQVEG